MNDDELLTAEIPAPRLTITEPPVPTTDTITEIYMDLDATGLGKLYNDSTRSRFFKFHMGTWHQVYTHVLHATQLIL